MLRSGCYLMKSDYPKYFHYYHNNGIDIKTKLIWTLKSFSDHFLTQLIASWSQVVHESYLKFIVDCELWWGRANWNTSEVQYCLWQRGSFTLGIIITIAKWCNSKAQSTSCARCLCRPSWAHYPLAYKIVVRQRSAKRKK